MTRRFRGLVFAVLLLVTSRADAQLLGVLCVTVVVTGREQRATPVPRHVLLISDNPASAPPRRILTSSDGAIDVRLPPGNYTVESDRPVAFEGQAYQWTQTVDVVAGRDTRLELTGANAEIEALTATPPSAAAPLTEDPWSSTRWQESVVALWTPTVHASGTVIDANGLLVTSSRAIGNAAAVEVQLSPRVKVAASLLVSDLVRDVAVLRIDPATAASVRPVPLGCGQAAPLLGAGDEIVAIESPLRHHKGPIDGTVTRLSASLIEADLMPAFGGAGGPVFTTDGKVVGIVSIGDASRDGRDRNTPVVRIGVVCDVVAIAEAKMKDAPPPPASRLPVEPVDPFPAKALDDTGARPAGGFRPYQTSSSDFDLTFFTPPQIAGVQDRRGLMDFRNWSEYVADRPPVLLVRATPKLVEGFWTKVARGAALTQGIALPAFKRPKSGFSRMRAFCGEAEVTPIHPFKIEQTLSAAETIFEGLYVFDPAAFTPSCASVKLVLYSEKEPEKADTRVIDPKLIQQVWQDFAPYRAPK